MKKILEFLQSSSGEMSSKRLAFIFCQPFITVAMLVLIDRLIDKEQYKLAYEVYKCFSVYCLFLGGFITSELILKIIPFKKK